MVTLTRAASTGPGCGSSISRTSGAAIGRHSTSAASYRTISPSSGANGIRSRNGSVGTRRHRRGGTAFRSSRARRWCSARKRATGASYTCISRKRARRRVRAASDRESGAGMPPDLPRFSLRLHQGLTPQACRALAASAEAHGFHTLWFAENPFGRAILPAIAVCAADTSRVRLGLGILNPDQHHPTLIAQEAAVLDELSGGRVRLGIGSGIAQRIALLGTRYRPLAALSDAVQIVRGLLRHETVTHRGTHFRPIGWRLSLPRRAPICPSISQRWPTAVSCCAAGWRTD